MSTETSDKPTPSKPTTTGVISRELAAMVRTIADHRDINMAEALERYARPAVAEEYRRVLTEMQALATPAGA